MAKRLKVAASKEVYILDAVRIAGSVKNSVFKDCVVIFEQDCELADSRLTRCLFYMRDEKGDIVHYDACETEFLNEAERKAFEEGVNCDGVRAGSVGWSFEKFEHLQSLVDFSLRFGALRPQ